jgi:membrane-bound lytic murein transglycosylase MltF
MAGIALGSAGHLPTGVRGMMMLTRNTAQSLG